MSILLAVILLLVLAVAAGVIWNEPLKSVAERLYQAIARPTVRGSHLIAGHHFTSMILYLLTVGAPPPSFAPRASRIFLW